MKGMNILHLLTLDKNHEEPLYLQLANSLEKAILMGHVRHGELLPTEKLLSEAFDISPKVILMAYQHLAEKKVVKRLVGKGTQVDTRVYLDVNFKEILNAEKGLSITFHTVFKNIIFNEQKTPIESAEILSVHQVAMADKNPLYFRKIYLDPALYPEDYQATDVITYTRDVMKLDSIKLSSKMMVVNLPAVEAAFLNVEPESAGFYVRTHVQQKDRVIAFIRTYFSGDYTVWSDLPEAIRF